jgi:hypothetical protein
LSWILQQELRLDKRNEVHLKLRSLDLGQLADLLVGELDVRVEKKQHAHLVG